MYIVIINPIKLQYQSSLDFPIKNKGILKLKQDFWTLKLRDKD